MLPDLTNLAFIADQKRPAFGIVALKKWQTFLAQNQKRR
jgi:hypothetical protein